ncbi:MAG: hypothetical protein NTV70_12220 [Acidobacteria bacterium]|nr:hypothetical protein [Acidobacteriota bacterium]
MSDANSSLKTIDNAYFERTWKILQEIGEAERHFNTLQQSYRLLASTWLLAAFGGAGFLFEKLSVSQYLTLALAGIGVLSSFGILLLWNLDLRVYHQLLDAYFEEGLQLEAEHSWLPQVRHRMVSKHGDSGERVTIKVVLFYTGLVGLLQTTAAGCVGAWLFHRFGLWPAVGMVVAGLSLTALLIRQMVRAVDFE